MTAALVLSKAISLIAAPNRWTRGATATDAKGNICLPRDDQAKRFDMIGAIQHVESKPQEYGEAIMHLKRVCGGSIYEFNDEKGHTAVLNAMKRAQRAAERSTHV